MWNNKYDIKQSHRHIGQTCGCLGEVGEMGVWDQQMQTSIYRMDKQSPTMFNILW